MSLPATSDSSRTSRIVVLIPCLNEEGTIARVVQDFRAQLPEAEVIVFDNGSSDKTVELALGAGAVLMSEKRRGKGHVVQAMFQNVEADVYVMVDGDDTYPADRVKALIAPVLQGEADMSIGSRMMAESRSAMSPMSRIGNKFFRIVINWIFRTRLTDILSGYRCLGHSLVKSLPLFVKGFEVEAEITIKSLERGFRLIEVPVGLRSRQEGSFSKIRALRDGLSILGTIFSLFRDYKPLTFFGSVGIVFFALGVAPGVYALLSSSDSSQPFSILLGILAVGLDLIGVLLVAVGLILHTVNRRFQELEHLMRLVGPRPDGAGH